MSAPLKDIGALNRRLVLEAPAETGDGAGGVVRTYEALTTLWAQVTPVSARGDIAADSLGAALRHRIVIRARDRHFAEYTLEADGLLAVCIQHELDHLEGKVFVDYLSPFKREQVRRRLEKAKRDAKPVAANEHAL